MHPLHFLFHNALATYNRSLHLVSPAVAFGSLFLTLHIWSLTASENVRAKAMRLVLRSTSSHTFTFQFRILGFQNHNSPHPILSPSSLES